MSDAPQASAYSCAFLSPNSSIFSFIKLPFHKIKNVRLIEFSCTVDEIIDPLLDDYLDVSIDEETFPELRELSFFFTRPAGVSSLGGLLQQITHLSLLFLHDLSHLEVLLQNLPHVQSLTLQALRDDQEEQLFAAFKHGPFNLPHLTQLAIIGEDREDAFKQLPATSVPLLAELVRGIPTLRCFDCSICIASTHMELLLPALKQLRVLGLHVGPVDSRGLFCGIVRHIPTELDALALFVSLSGVIHGHEWAELWTRCQRLRYLYLRSCHDDEDDVEGALEFLAEAGKSLRLVGLQNAVHYVERDDGSVRLSEKWSKRKLEFRGVDDFGCPEWEWLMRETNFDF